MPFPGGYTRLELKMNQNAPTLAKVQMLKVKHTSGRGSRIFGRGGQSGRTV